MSSAELAALTGLSHESAALLLEAAGGDLQAAASLHFDQPSFTPLAAASSDDEEPRAVLKGRAKKAAARRRASGGAGGADGGEYDMLALTEEFDEALGLQGVLELEPGPKPPPGTQSGTASACGTASGGSSSPVCSPAASHTLTQPSLDDESARVRP